MTIKHRLQKLETQKNVQITTYGICTCPDEETMNSFDKLSAEQATRAYFQFIHCDAHIPDVKQVSTGRCLEMTPQQAEREYKRIVLGKS